MDVSTERSYLFGRLKISTIYLKSDKHKLLSIFIPLAKITIPYHLMVHRINIRRIPTFVIPFKSIDSIQNNPLGFIGYVIITADPYIAYRLFPKEKRIPEKFYDALKEYLDSNKPIFVDTVLKMLSSVNFKPIVSKKAIIRTLL
jgi:hypothetical protein